MQLKLNEVPVRETLDQQVSTLLHKIKTRDASTLSRIKPFVADPESAGEATAQRIIARDYGFSSWAKLIDWADRRQTIAADQFAPDQIACEFLRLVVLVYSETEYADPQRFAQAAELLETYPAIRDESIYTAAAIGDADKINAWLAADPSLINRRGGFHDWEPIMYAAYSRLPSHSTLKAGCVLLQHDANPNAHYLWGGQYVFTALTGVLGQGEGGPEKLPEHPDAEAFARSLLSAGADPNDSQAAYNRMFTPDNLCLELLMEYGIGQSDKNNWLQRDEKDPEQLQPHPAATLHYQLCHAVRLGFIERVKLLVEYGVDINQPEADAPTPRTPLEIALLSMQRTVADYLQSQGAADADFDRIDQFYIACFEGDEDRARALLSADQQLVAATESRFPGVLSDAVDLADTSALALMLDLGFNPNFIHHRTALHQAAWKGDIRKLEILIAAGGDTSIRDRTYFASPIGWALEHEQTATVAFLKGCKMDIFTAVAQGLSSIVSDMLTRDPSLLDVKFSAYRPDTGAYCANDWCTPLAFAWRLNQLAIVELLLENGASTALHDDQGNSFDTLITEWAKQGGHESILKRLTTAP